MAGTRGVSANTLLTQLTEAAGPNTAIAPMIVPPDGGWGWVIVLVGLLSSGIIDGCTYSFYLFREPMSKELHSHPSDMSFLSSLNTGFYFLGAVFACSFANHWGFRLTALTGSIVCTLAFIAGCFFQEMIYYYLVIGVLGGLAEGFTAVGVGLPASFYFDKKRSLVLGIVSCGSGLGGMVMPALNEFVMNHYDWRNTFLFEGGCVGITIVLALLIIPLKPVMVVIEVESPTGSARPTVDSVMDYSAFKIPVDATSVFSFHRSMVGEMAQPTIAQIMADEMSAVNIIVREKSNPTILSRFHDLTVTQDQAASSASGVWANNIQITVDPVIKRSLPWYKCGCCRSKTVSLPHRPLMRNDLYYTGSLKRLPWYNKDKKLEYNMNVTRVPTYYQIIQDLTKNYSTWCCHNIFIGLGYLVDYKMFKSLAFNCLALCGFATYIAFYLPYLFCNVHLEALGAGNYTSRLVSLIGFGSMVGRLLSGLIITSFPRLDARTVISIMSLLSAVSITCMVLHPNIYFKGTCLFMYGFTIGFFAPFKSLIVVDYFGLEKLTSATGVLIICIGLGSFIGPSLAESAMSYTNDKNAPFYLCGVVLLLACVSLLPMKKLRNWENQRAQRKKSLTRRQPSLT